ncbi:MAG: cupredoxin domain-containing protein [Solirubrobacteraceae bacterium]
MLLSNRPLEGIRMRKLPVPVPVPVLALALMATVAAPAVGALAASAPKPLKVTVGDNFFQPAKKTVPRGTKVTWTWKGVVVHDVRLVTAPKGIKKSKYTSDIQGSDGEPFTRTLKAKGKWYFVCTLHSEMEQTISVK